MPNPKSHDSAKIDVSVRLLPEAVKELDAMVEAGEARSRAAAAYSLLALAIKEHGIVREYRKAYGPPDTDENDRLAALKSSAQAQRLTSDQSASMQ